MSRKGEVTPKSESPAVGAAPSSSSPSIPQNTEVVESSISNKLDVLTTLVMTLADKTNQALSEVARLNQRLDSPSSPTSGSPSTAGTGFHLDTPKPPKGWKETPGAKRKSDKKNKNGKSSEITPNVPEKDNQQPQDVPASTANAKRTESDEEEKRDKDGDQTEPESRGFAHVETDRRPFGSPYDHRIGVHLQDPFRPRHEESSQPPRSRSPSYHHREQGSFSGRSTLRSRASMSSIDLNEVNDLEGLNTVIKLNVGGRNFYTTKSTLTTVPGTMFEALLSGRYAVVRDAEGGVFLDRDPDTFEAVLTYLRDPRQMDLKFYSQQQQMRILCEMDYFMIPFQRVTRDLPRHITGHTITVERENQWNLKWTARGGRWPGEAQTGDGVSSSASQAALIASTSQGLMASQSSSSQAAILAATAAKSAERLAQAGASGAAFMEAPPQLKFVDDDLVYVNIKSRPLRAYDLWTGQCLTIIKDSYCDAFAVSREHLVTYDADDQSLRLWNAKTSAGIAWIKADVPPTNVSCLAFINESALVLGGDGNKCVTLNLPALPDQPATATTVLQGANLRQIEPLSSSVVAVGSTNGNIILWNVKLNVLLGTLPTAQQRISTIFSRDNFIYCISPETIKVWDCSTNPSKPSCVATIFDEVTTCDADGDLIVGITHDRSRKNLLKIWSLSSSKLVHVMSVPATEQVHLIKVRGNRLATILDDGTVLTWTITLVN